MATKKVVFEIDIKGSKEVFELQKQIKQLKKDLSKTDDPTVADQLLKDLARLQTELKKAQAQAKLAQAEFEAKDSTIGSYKQLSAQLFVARERFKQLGAEAIKGGNVTREQLEAARLEAARLDSQLKRVDSATGVFGRNVGNYAGSLKGLFGELKSTILSSGLIGRGGIGAIGNMLANGVRGAVDAIDQLNTALDAQYRTQKLVNEGTKEAISEYTDERAQLDFLFAAVTDVNATQEERAKALAAINEQYSTYLPNQLTELSTEQEIADAYKAVNAAIIEQIVVKKRAELIEKALNEAIQAQIEADKARAASAVSTGFAIIDIARNVNATVQEQNAETAKKVAANDQQIEASLRKALTDIGAYGLDFSKAFSGNLDDLTKQTTKAAEKQGKDYQKTLEEIEKKRAKFFEDSKKFNQDQANDIAKLQAELSKAIVDNIEDEGQKAVAQEKLNYEFRKAEREAQFNNLKAKIQEQETKLLEVYEEGSAEVIAFRKETTDKLAQLETTFAQLSEQDAIAHQQALIEIQAKGLIERNQQEEAAFQKRIAQSQTELTELENAYQLQFLQIQEAVAKREQTVEAGAKAEFDARKKYLQEQADLIQQNLNDGLFADEQARQQLVLQRQKLNTELAQLEEEQTEKVKTETDKQKAARLAAIQQVLQTGQQVIGAIASLADAVNQREIKQLDDQLQARQKNIADLEAQLENASGFEAEYLENKVAQEKAAADGIAAAKANAEKQAAKTAKAFAIIQAIINTALGITNALASLPPPASFITAAITGALGAVEIATIAAQPLATGGVVGRDITGKPIRRSNGDNVLTTLKTGEVVLNQNQQQRLGYDALAFAGVPGFATGGIVPTIPSLPPSINSAVEQNNQLTELILAVNGRIDRLQVDFTPNTQAAINKDNKDRKEINTRRTL